MIIRKLILNNTSYPTKFLEIENLNLPENIDKKDYIEQQIIQKINKYNPKLNISEILYENLNDQFEGIYTSTYTGAIVEDIKITEDKQEIYREKGYFTYSSDEAYYARGIIEYVYISGTKEGSRDIFVSQIIFPTLIDYIEEYIDSPSYEPANHKFMFINIVNKKITANTIINLLSLLAKTGVDYVEVFYDSVDLKNIPDKLEYFYPANNISENIYEDEFYKIDYNQKQLKIKKNFLENNIEFKTERFRDFKGSCEKFYWTPVYATAIFAYKIGYKVDYSEYEYFCNRYNEFFSPRSGKFYRCKILLKYFNKYFK